MYTTRRGGFDREDARFHYEQLQKHKVALQQHLHLLQQECVQAFGLGEWDRVDRIQLCIDDTSDELKKLS
jgi:hypothetical protein